MSVNEFDIAFIIDTTGSMGSYIMAAKQDLVKILKELTEHSDVDVRVGVVEYRDHKPQEYTFVAKAHKFVLLVNVQEVINQLHLGGGGDAPEAVFDGVVAAAENLKWRNNARRVAILVGDAPPHGYYISGNDAWPDGCPCGKTLETTALAMEEAGITLHSIGLTTWVIASFKELSNLTGGMYFTSSDRRATKEIRSLIEREFKDIAFDKDVLSLWEDGLHDKFDIAARLQCTVQNVLDSIGRMRSRNLIVSEECA